VFTNSIFQIVEDVAEAKHMAVEDLKDEIDEEAEKIKEALPDRAKKIRDEVVEEVTGKKLVNHKQNHFYAYYFLILVT